MNLIDYAKAFVKPSIDIDAYLLDRSGAFTAARIRDSFLWINLLVQDPMLQFHIQLSMEQAVQHQITFYPERQYITLAQVDYLLDEIPE